MSRAVTLFSVIACFLYLATAIPSPEVEEHYEPDWTDPQLTTALIPHLFNHDNVSLNDKIVMSSVSQTWRDTVFNDRKSLVNFNRECLRHPGVLRPYSRGHVLNVFSGSCLAAYVKACRYVKVTELKLDVPDAPFDENNENSTPNAEEGSTLNWETMENALSCRSVTKVTLKFPSGEPSINAVVDNTKRILQLMKRKRIKHLGIEQSCEDRHRPAASAVLEAFSESRMVERYFQGLDLACMTKDRQQISSDVLISYIELARDSETLQHLGVSIYDPFVEDEVARTIRDVVNNEGNKISSLSLANIAYPEIILSLLCSPKLTAFSAYGYGDIREPEVNEAFERLKTCLQRKHHYDLLAIGPMPEDYQTEEGFPQSLECDRVTTRLLDVLTEATSITINKLHVSIHAASNNVLESLGDVIETRSELQEFDLLIFANDEDDHRKDLPVMTKGTSSFITLLHRLVLSNVRTLRLGGVVLNPRTLAALKTLVSSKRHQPLQHLTILGPSYLLDGQTVWSDLLELLKSAPDVVTWWKELFETVVDSELQQFVFEYGSWSYFSKPIDTEVMLKLIQQEMRDSVGCLALELSGSLSRSILKHKSTKLQRVNQQDSVSWAGRHRNDGNCLKELMKKRWIWSYNHYEYKVAETLNWSAGEPEEPVALAVQPV